MRELVLGKVPSEFEIQAAIYGQMLAHGLTVRGEVRASIRGVKARFDLVVLDGAEARYIVEVKPKRSARWRAEWMRLPQAKLYATAPVPVFMVCGHHQAEAFMEMVRKDALAYRPGLIWIEEWAMRDPLASDAA